MEEKRNHHLASRVVPLVVLIVLALFVLQNFMLSNSVKKKVSAQSIAQYSALTESYNLLLTERISQYVTAMDRHTHAEANNSQNINAILGRMMEMSANRGGFDYISYVSKDGDYFSDMGERGNVKNQEYYKAIMEDRNMLYIDAPTTSSTGQTVVHICVPAMSRGQWFYGFYIGNLVLDNFKTIFESCKSGKTGYAVLYCDDTVMSSAGNYDMAKSVITSPAISSESHEQPDGSVVASSWRQVGKEQKFMCSVDVKNTPWKVGFIIDRSEVMELTSSIGKTLSLIGIVIIAIMVLVLSILIVTSLKPLTVVESSISNIASGEADLTKRIDMNVESRTEIARIVEGFNNFSGKLQEIISATKESKDILVTAGNNLSSTTQETVASISQILTNISEMENNILNQNASVLETSGSVCKIATGIDSLNDMIETQVESITHASGSIQQMIKSIDLVNSSISSMANSFDELESKVRDGVARQTEVNETIKIIESESEALKEANDVISSIAEQTNLLAMNAAIEAAHAGEAGKGFSVVADEIRKLSETSSGQSKTIGDQLAKITGNISQMVVVSRDASSALESVSKGINDTNAVVQRIKGSMGDQEADSMQISVALGDMIESSGMVKNAAKKMSGENKSILAEIKTLQDSTLVMRNGMSEMTLGADKIKKSGSDLSSLSEQMENAIQMIGQQVDRFKV